MTSSARHRNIIVVVTGAVLWALGATLIIFVSLLWVRLVGAVLFGAGLGLAVWRLSRRK